MSALLAPRPSRRPSRILVTVLVTVLAAACGAAACVAARAQDADPPASLHLRGLLELPGSPDAGPAGAALASARRPGDAPATIELYAEPDLGVGARLADVTAGGLATAERAPDVRGTLVFDVRTVGEDAWYLLARQADSAITGYGWYRAGPAERMSTYPELVVEGLSFMRNGWDGRLHATPSDPVPHRVIPPSGGGAIRVVDAWMDPENPADSWFLIVVFVEDSVCTDEWPVVVASGWVRAYRDDAGPAAWFHSGGC